MPALPLHVTVLVAAIRGCMQEAGLPCV